jgi:hypothetical protein
MRDIAITLFVWGGIAILAIGVVLTFIAICVSCSNS